MDAWGTQYKVLRQELLAVFLFPRLEEPCSDLSHQVLEPSQGVSPPLSQRPPQVGLSEKKTRTVTNMNVLEAILQGFGPVRAERLSGTVSFSSWMLFMLCPFPPCVTSDGLLQVHGVQLWPQTTF